MAKRQLLLVAVEDDQADPPDMIPLGSRKSVYKKLSAHNIAPDVPNGEFLYGPGITMQIPMTGANEINQILCVLADEDLAWVVLPKVCQQLGWALMDPESARILTTFIA